MGSALSLEDWKEEPVEELLHRQYFVNANNRLLGDFMEEVAGISECFGDEYYVRITPSTSEMQIDVMRHETYEEYVERVTSHDRWKEATQKKADSSWKRQQRKFANARNKVRKQG